MRPGDRERLHAMKAYLIGDPPGRQLSAEEIRWLDDLLQDAVIDVTDVALVLRLAHLGK